MTKRDELLEWATVFDNRYGTPRAPVEGALSAGQDVLFDIDWQGTQQLREKARADVVSVFILPPSAADLEKRLHTRAQDSDAVIRGRMSRATHELSHWAEYDYIVINHDIDEAFAEVQSILKAERLKRGAPHRPDGIRTRSAAATGEIAGGQFAAALDSRASISVILWSGSSGARVSRGSTRVSRGIARISRGIARVSRGISPAVIGAPAPRVSHRRRSDPNPRSRGDRRGPSRPSGPAPAPESEDCASDQARQRQRADDNDQQGPDRAGLSCRGRVRRRQRDRGQWWARAHPLYHAASATSGWTVAARLVRRRCRCRACRGADAR